MIPEPPPVDQGTRYELVAMIARPGVLEPVCVVHPCARLVELEQGLALIPMTESLVGSLEPGEVAVPPETGFRAVSAGVWQLLQQTSTAGPVAYVEADYLGRDGWQTAAVWQRALAYGPFLLGTSEPFPRTGGGPIGAALRCLGVVAGQRHDEFVRVGLGRHRRTEYWE
ncbi:MAG: hypothetical protein GEU83_18460 [Pseudonocardiaceae bacterium]|nr:hypothetical protein [Pseudonocardiaceae bacterium]